CPSGLGVADPHAVFGVSRVATRTWENLPNPRAVCGRIKTMKEQMAIRDAVRRPADLTLADDAPLRPRYSALAPGDRGSQLLVALTALAMMAALYAIFVYAPTERVMGHVQRIFYVHVSLAWLSYLAFLVVFIASIVYLWRRDERWDAVARASAEIGVVF